MTKSKNILGTVSAVVVGLLMCICSFVMFACGPKDYGENAIVISNYEELKTFLTDFSTKDYLDSAVSDDGKFVVISNNIDCKGEVLTPLLSADFRGLGFRFDGDGHTISNFKLDNTSLRSVGTQVGSGSGNLVTLALFPRAEGGELTNIEFRDFTYELTDYDIGAAAPSLNVGLVGYSKSSGQKADNPDAKTTTYKNIKITNMNVKIKTVSAYQEAGYPFVVGSLIGLDADTVAKDPAIKIEDTAIRENITVKNFNVDIDMQGGAVLVGGIAGLNNWENATYKNSTVTGTVKVVNHGTNTGTYERKNLGSIISAGGVTGGIIKNNAWTIVNVENVKTDIKYTLSTASGDKHSNAGKYLGIVCAKEPPVSEVNISENCTSTSTVKVGEAEAVAVENNYLAK